MPGGICAPGGSCWAITWFGVDVVVPPDEIIFAPIVPVEKFEGNPTVVVCCCGGVCKTTRLGPGVAVAVVLVVLTTVPVAEGEEKICNRPSGIWTNCCPGKSPRTCILPSAERTIWTFC